MAGRAGNSCVRPGQRKVCWRPGVIKGRADPAVKRVTHLAVLRKLAGNVIRIGGLLEICPVTGNTSGRKPLKLPHCGTLVTILALRGRVSPEQRKAILVGLYLLDGDVPALNGVTLRTVRPHPSLVDVGMTVLAILPDIRENRLQVAPRALHFFMHTTQRILGVVVVEFRVRLDRAPRCGRVTIFAREVQRRAMRTCGSRPTLLLRRLRGLAGRRTITSGISHDGQGQQRPQNELEHCRRKFPFLRWALNSPAGKGALEVPSTLC